MRGIFDLDRWQEIWMTITHNKSRSVLTAFGVFWGTFMLVVMVGAGNALEKGMTAQIQGFATNSCFFNSNQTTLPYRGFKKGRSWDIVNEDIPSIRQNVKEIEYLSPMIFNFSENKNVVRESKSGQYLVKGCYPEYNKIDQSLIVYGRFINDIDISEKRKVCLIGERVYEVLFTKGENPIGKIVRVNGIYFSVIGVLRSLSSANIGGNNQESVILPFTTMQQTFNRGNRVDFLMATAKPNVKVSKVQNAVITILKNRHQISPDDKKAIFSANIEEQFAIFENLSIGIHLLIWIVGMGTLLTGAIGISNIMLVTVRERTKEIGIRRAIGATPSNIISQILSESAILTILAGIGGLIIGVGVLSAASIVISQGNPAFKDTQISFLMGIGALLILTVIGVLAGFIPANRAMSIKPIEAIREE